MKRSMMQVYVKDSGAAVKLYQRAFDAKIGDNWPNGDGSWYHCEMDLYGQCLAVAEAAGEAAVAGNVMQFCLHFAPGEELLVEKAYAALCEGGRVDVPLGPCEFSPLMADVTDRFGVRWCLFAV